ncbi:MAG: N-acetylmuramoyl-L-alanine amidase family protein [Acidobacteriaceae bacterium]
MRWTRKHANWASRNCLAVLGTRRPLLLAAVGLLATSAACAQATSSVPQSSPTQATASGSPASLVQPPPTAPDAPAAELRFLVMLDPAHGGAEPGALLGPDEPEKNYTLELAIRLHAMLNAQGVPTIFSRTGDVSLDNDARATIANRAHASACILLHATSTGNGVHLFTSSLPVATSGGADVRREFLPWQTAQASFATQSLRLESDINAALTSGHVPVLLSRTSLMPLDSMACPAVAVEIAPLDSKTPLTDAAYQQTIVASLAAALVAWRSDWRQKP